MPKRTNQPKKVKRQKKHGFLHRRSTADGQNILQRRQKRGRKVLSQ